MKLRLATVVLAAAITACAVAQDDAPVRTAGPTLPTAPLQAKAGTADGPSYLYELRGELVDPRIATQPILDPVRHRVLMQGGWTSGVVRNDTLEWDGIGWQRRVSAGQPGSRFAAGNVYDAHLARTLLFGGFSATSPLLAVADSATWEWNGSDWAELYTEGAPSPRGGAPLAQDPNTHDFYLFGGSVQVDGNPSLVTSDDFYKFDGIHWTKIEKPAGAAWPSNRAAAALAWDPTLNQLMLFGGFGAFSTDAAGHPNVGEPRYDTWTWDGAAWTQRQTQNAPTGEIFTLPNGNPAPLAGHQTLLVDPKTGSLLLTHETLGGIEVWKFDAAVPTWNAVYVPQHGGVGPNFRLLSNSFIDPITGDVVVSGGLGSSAPLGFTRAELIIAVANDEDPTDYFSGEGSNEQWAFDGAAWHLRSTPADPGPRAFAAAAYHEDLGAAVLFGGRFGASTVLGDTWVWNGGHWAAASGGTQPQARYGHALAYDPTRKAVVLFGGQDAANGFLGDTWTWNGSTWSQLDLETGPSARTGMQLLRTDAGVVLTGGLTESGEHSLETWILHASPNGWQRLPDGLQGNSYDACTASSAATGAYLFGGVRRQDDKGTDDFIRFDPQSNQWGDVPVTEDTFELQERRQCALFADPARNQITLGGGLGGAVDSNWNQYDLAANLWRVITPRTYDRLMDPPRRVVSAAYFFDPKVGAPTYYGGSAPGVETVTDETWRIREVGATCGTGGACAVGTTCVDGVCCEASACGPCETCAAPGNRGVCTPRGEIAPTDGCPAAQGLSCNAAGRCRSADGSACQADAQCASGTCIAGNCCSAAGCTQRCIDDGTLRTASGNETQCGAYLCRGDRCLDACTSLSDCAAGSVCDGTNHCVASASAGSDEAPGGCNESGASPSTGLLGLAALALFLRRGTNRPH